jgi:hypothetical protein
VSAAELPGLRLLLAAKARLIPPGAGRDPSMDMDVLVGLGGTSGRKVLLGDAMGMVYVSDEGLATMHLSYWREHRRLPRARWWMAKARVGLEDVYRLSQGEPAVIHIPHRNLLATLTRTDTLVKPSDKTVDMLKAAMCKASLRAL